MEQPLFVALKMADVIAMWQDGTATFYGIGRWQMLLPGGRWNSHCVYCGGRCHCQVADGITT